MPSCSANSANLDKNDFDRIYTMIAVQPSMAEYEWTMYEMNEELKNAIMLKSVLLDIIWNAVFSISMVPL